MRFLLTILFLFGFSVPAMAQEVMPDLPGPLQTMVDQGAQIRYLGKQHGMDGWVTIFKGQEQYFYVLPNKKAFVMGLLFDENGKAVTVQQVQSLQKQGDQVLDMLASGELPEDSAQLPPVVQKSNPFEYKPPAERMFADVEGSNWVSIGKRGAPVIYAFIDPQCPHCHAFMDDLRKGGYLESGQLQVRLIPVGFREETLAQAAFLLAAPDAEERFFNHLDGDTSALPAKYDISNQGIQKNLSIMQTWKFDVTPMIVYQDKVGNIKLVRGRVKDVPGMLSQLK